ncbi:unannotated protein [freshwater metagenome]|uniref:Unannotated protein n=1 Tax=freshwater metagenome TaxID=449393 RepID=A0A6J7JM07_9ZZZZ
MLNRRERDGRRPTDRLCRRIGRDQIWVFFFQRREFAEQHIEFGVGDFRGILLVIQPAVVANDLAQFVDTTCRIEHSIRRLGHGRTLARAAAQASRSGTD